MRIDRRDVGQLTLRNLRLKKGALDKFRLPVDVLEGVHISVLMHQVQLIESFQVISANSHYPYIG